jgi:DNA-binding transcriptional ArsR family regulator
MSDEYTGIQLDATAVRVLAHPLRSRLLSRLRQAGPATATELAEALGTNSGATSYHLRKLESVGLVTDTGDGEGKRRPWRATTESHAWRRSDFRDDEDASTAVSWLERGYARQLASRMDAWQDALEGWPADWVDACGLTDTMITATPEQVESFTAELADLLTRYRHVGDGDPAARRLSIFAYCSPTDLTAPEAS